jgi:hypothetical protein
MPACTQSVLAAPPGGQFLLDFLWKNRFDGVLRYGGLAIIMWLLAIACADGARRWMELWKTNTITHVLVTWCLTDFSVLMHHRHRVCLSVCPSAYKGKDCGSDVKFIYKSYTSGYDHVTLIF